MKTGIAVLVLSYGISQFFRTFLAVLTPDLQADLGAQPDDLARAAGVWFLVFAAMQLPIGALLDRVGPRLTASTLFAVGVAGGAVLFATAQSPAQIVWAMGLIGAGCAPVLMSGYFIFAKTYSPAVFATLAGTMLGLGSLGNLAGAAPLAAAVEAFGWRATMLGLAVFSGVLALMMAILIKNPPRGAGQSQGSVFDLLKMPQLWPLFAMMLVNYAPAAGLRGVWAGPYLQDIHHADAQVIGQVTFFMALAMIAGSFAYGPLERLLGTRKWLVFGANFSTLVGLVIFAAVPQPGLLTTSILLAIIGFGGSTFPLLVAHGKAFMPAHLTGRGVTLVNLFGIGGAGLAQFATAPIHKYGLGLSGDPIDAYRLVFIFFAVATTCGLCAYLWVQDRRD